MTLNFINKGHNGDLHYSKGFMRDLYNVLSPDECFLFHSCKRGAVKDLEFLDNNKNEIAPYKFLIDAKNSVEKLVTRKIELFGSADKA